MHAVKRLGTIVFLTAVACREEGPHRSPVPKASVSVGTVAAPHTAAASRSEAGPNASAYRAVRAWNDALDRHDLENLERIYGDEVFSYGYRRSKVDLLKAKRAMFEQRPNFRQEIIGDIDLQRPIEDVVVATFVTKSGPPENFEVTGARLELRGATLLVTEESDDSSLKQQNAISQICYDKAAEVVSSLASVVRVRAEVEHELAKSTGRKRIGGFGPQPDDAGGFQVVEGVYIEEFLHTRVRYEVDRGGHLTVWADKEVTPSRAALESVQRACRH